MSVAHVDSGTTASLDDGDDDVMRGIGGQISHEQIIGAIGRLEGLIEAEGEARRDFRETFLDRLKTVEIRTGTIAVDLQRIEHKIESQGSTGAIASVARAFERQPMLPLALTVIVLVLGSSGIIALWEAFAR